MKLKWKLSSKLSSNLAVDVIANSSAPMIFNDLRMLPQIYWKLFIRLHCLFHQSLLVYVGWLLEFPRTITLHFWRFIVALCYARKMLKFSAHEGQSKELFVYSMDLTYSSILHKQQSTFINYESLNNKLPEHVAYFNL